MPPDTQHEQNLWRAGARVVAGIDEAGRGCWAGPVVAAAVILPARLLACPGALAGVDDSKVLSAPRRQALAAHIRAVADGVGIGVVPAYLIDAFGIVAATRLAMQVAVLSLPLLPDALLIDAVALHELGRPQHALIHGDARCLSIAAASIIAKTTRDHLMESAEAAHPGYGFAAHKGYGTAAHARALRRLGPCGLHRRTFRPVMEVIA